VRALQDQLSFFGFVVVVNLVLIVLLILTLVVGVWHH
jgi:hypothetical protein